VCFRCLILFVCVLAFGCNRPAGNPAPVTPQNRAPVESVTTVTTLADARKGFTTKLARRESANTPFDNPPANLFRLVRYESPAGKLGAYLSPDPKDGKKHPAIIWITGGDSNTIDQGCWRQGSAKNDQSAGQFRQAGVLMMFPSARGGNDNPGFREGFYGEIDDVVAAAEFLAKEPYVDPNRIYLGGHSTGGTVALLTAESTSRFRAVFSFGPVDDPTGYGPEFTPFNTRDPREVELRSPVKWIASIKSPTFVFEGSQGNIESLQNMARASNNPKARFIEVKGADHFNILAPVNRMLAQKILADTGEQCNIQIANEDVNKLFGR
jgi:alpha/beta superfamily hydrolase